MNRGEGYAASRGRVNPRNGQTQATGRPGLATAGKCRGWEPKKREPPPRPAVAFGKGFPRVFRAAGLPAGIAI